MEANTEIECSSEEAPVDLPPVLVATWIRNLHLQGDENKDVRERATEMLVSKFGDMGNVQRFIEKHNLKV